ncbi:unnamed protein product, partial [Adineta steineri]
MGNTTKCSSKPSSPSKSTSPLYKLKTSSPLSTRIHHCNGQTYVQPLFPHFKNK